MKKIVCLYLFLFLILVSSCLDRNIRGISMEPLFSLGLGRMEDQIDAVYPQGVSVINQDSHYMQDGLVYIANGKANKISKFSSYGDILEILYNPDENPVPFLVNSSKTDNSNKRADAYPFNQITDFAVSPDDTLYVADMVPLGMAETDEENNLVLNQIVLRFPSGGGEPYYLGQEGIGGTPFSRIEKLETSMNGDITIFCRFEHLWRIFTFSESGILLYDLIIDEYELPLPPTANEGYFPSLDTMVKDPATSHLHIKIDYYRQILDDDGELTEEVKFEQSMIYSFSLEKGEYESLIRIPHNLITDNSAGFQHHPDYENLYDLIGLTDGGNFFLISLTEKSQYELLILDLVGRKVSSRILELDQTGLVQNSFSLSRSGILSSMILAETEVRFVWWRSDRLIKERDR